MGRKEKKKSERYMTLPPNSWALCCEKATIGSGSLQQMVQLIEMSKIFEKNRKKVLTKGFLPVIICKLLREKRTALKNLKKNLKKVLDK